MINIVIPMAGLGSRFLNAGYKTPKPLIPIHGVPMIRLVIENTRPKINHRFIFICQRQHIKDFDLTHKLKAWAPSCEIIEIDGITEGAACTVLTARELIDTETPMIIANSDQFVTASIDDYIQKSKQCDGLIMTMYGDDPKWSYAELGQHGLVKRVAEKEVISNSATVGIYHFKSGKKLVAAADEMIRKNLRVNNEFYVAPIYNELIKDGAEIQTFDVEAAQGGMHGLGTPSDLEKFLNHSISREITSKIPK